MQEWLDLRTGSDYQKVTSAVLQQRKRKALVEAGPQEKVTSGRQQSPAVLQIADNKFVTERDVTNEFRRLEGKDRHFHKMKLLTTLDQAS